MCIRSPSQTMVRQRTDMYVYRLRVRIYAEETARRSRDGWTDAGSCVQKGSISDRDEREVTRNYPVTPVNLPFTRTRVCLRCSQKLLTPPERTGARVERASSRQFAVAWIFLLEFVRNRNRQ